MKILRSKDPSGLASTILLDIAFVEYHELLCDAVSNR